MNTAVTSKTAILNVCRELIQTQGPDAINIRAVAKACNISTGSIYNYFKPQANFQTIFSYLGKWR
ncbi:TetR/AcrR family transcriptional regulator [bacterium C-53]|nr:TetR/AcrR family transcriptional regulator [Lachnospiraceae bacterium]NBI04800.1 TetR/AcrR family transcriptional regulator [Lachnospiraceae bacterium]RKJ07758.1 TetR/AcrR family transcriptional regulator [bacterium C-53]